MGFLFGDSGGGGTSQVSAGGIDPIFEPFVNDTLLPGLTQWAQVNRPMVGQSIFNQGLQYPTLGVPRPWVPGAQAPTGMQPGGGVKGGSSNYSTGTTQANPALDAFFNSFNNTVTPNMGGYSPTQTLPGSAYAHAHPTQVTGAGNPIEYIPGLGLTVVPAHTGGGPGIPGVAHVFNHTKKGGQ